MQEEWAHDGGKAAAGEHRRLLVRNFDRCRAALDAFSPDIVLIWGDDRYENFREDVIPPYAVLAYADIAARPWSEAQRSSAMTDKTNVWGEAPDTLFNIRGAHAEAKQLVTELLARDFDVAYSYRPLHHKSLPHAFMNTWLFLDYQRSGLDYPLIPFSINCYGRSVISRKGFLVKRGEEGEPDPPSPSPRRTMELGAALAEIVLDSPLKVVLIASSSWSHAFLCEKTWRLQPDTAADRKLYDLMVRGSYSELGSITLDEMEEAGQHELLNWFALFGAMRTLDRKPIWAEMVESYVFNSNKVFALY